MSRSAVLAHAASAACVDLAITLGASAGQLAEAGLIRDLARRTSHRPVATLDESQRRAAASLGDQQVVERRQSRIVLSPKAAYGAYLPKASY